MTNPRSLRPWDPTTYPASAKAATLVNEAVEDQFQARKHRLAKDGRSARRPGPERARKESATVAALLLDVVAAHIVLPADWIKISLDRNWLTGGPKDQPARNGTVSDRLYDLEGAGWIETNLAGVTSGASFSSIRVGARAIERGEALGISLEDIGAAPSTERLSLKGERLSGKDDRRQRLQVPDNTLTRKLTGPVAKLQDAIQRARLGTRPGAPVAIDTRRRHFWRSFLDGRFDRGGRLAGPAFWLTLRKEVRRRDLLIEREPIAEVDVKASIPSVAYALAGVRLQHDPYVPPELAGSVDREALKPVFLQLMWQPLSANTRLPANARQAIPSKFKAKDVYAALIAHNRPIAEMLGAQEPQGAALLFEESEYLIQACQRAFANRITALPLHDALLVPHGKAEEARDILAAAFQGRFGIPVTVTVEEQKHPEAYDE